MWLLEYYITMSGNILLCNWNLPLSVPGKGSSHRGVWSHWIIIERTFLMTSVRIVLLVRKLWSADSAGWTGLKRPCIEWLAQRRAYNNVTNLLWVPATEVLQFTPSVTSHYVKYITSIIYDTMLLYGMSESEYYHPIAVKQTANTVVYTLVCRLRNDCNGRSSISL